MKIEFESLKKAIKWIEENTGEMTVNVFLEGTKMHLKVHDRLDSEVIITLFEDDNLLPKIQKSEILK